MKHLSKFAFVVLAICMLFASVPALAMEKPRVITTSPVQLAIAKLGEQFAEYFDRMDLNGLVLTKMRITKAITNLEIQWSKIDVQSATEMPWGMSQRCVEFKNKLEKMLNDYRIKLKEVEEEIQTVKARMTQRTEPQARL